jgi:hypothetical protein
LLACNHLIATVAGDIYGAVLSSFNKGLLGFSPQSTTNVCSTPHRSAFPLDPYILIRDLPMPHQ